MCFIKEDAPVVMLGSILTLTCPSSGRRLESKALVGRQYDVGGRALKRESESWVLFLAVLHCAV